MDYPLLFPLAIRLARPTISSEALVTATVAFAATIADGAPTKVVHTPGSCRKIVDWVMNIKGIYEATKREDSSVRA
jgi:hypothetical protein